MSYGHFKICKWLYSLGADIKSVDKIIFRGCADKYLEIAQWLHSLGSDIYSGDDVAFIYSCTQRQFETAKWLYSLDQSIIWRNIRSIENIQYSQFGISSQSALLFECIRKNEQFSQIDYIEGCVLITI